MINDKFKMLKKKSERAATFVYTIIIKLLI